MAVMSDVFTRLYGNNYVRFTRVSAHRHCKLRFVLRNGANKKLVVLELSSCQANIKSCKVLAEQDKGINNR